VPACLPAHAHHERWDGMGYPGYINIETGKPISGYENDNGRARGKKGDEIPLFGRIVALADVYDALISKRSYKEPWDEEIVLKILREEKGKHFDPEIVDSFFEVHDVIKSITSRYPDD